jgi:RNA polymerase sigma-70 factor (ECF subfamily)
MAINTTEQELLFKERTGEEFSFFYKKFYPRLVYKLNGITQDEHLAQDVATEAFMKAFEKIEQYEKGKAQFSTWLFTIGRHLALQEIKSSRQTMSIDNELDDEGTTLKDFIQEESNNDEFLFVLNNKKADILKREIEKLKQPYRNVIEMREIKKMQYKDIACAMGKDVTFKITIGEESIVKLPIEISKAYRVIDKYGNDVNFELLKGEQFFEEIRIEGKGTYDFFGREPKNLSTIKSQIRNSRNLLIESSKKEFEILEEMYL